MKFWSDQCLWFNVIILINLEPWGTDDEVNLAWQHQKRVQHQEWQRHQPATTASKDHWGADDSIVRTNRLLWSWLSWSQGRGGVLSITHSLLDPGGCGHQPDQGDKIQALRYIGSVSPSVWIRPLTSLWRAKKADFRCPSSFCSNVVAPHLSYIFIRTAPLSYLFLISGAVLYPRSLVCDQAFQTVGCCSSRICIVDGS